MNRNILLPALLLLTIPCFLAAAPRERSEAVAPDNAAPQVGTAAAAPTTEKATPTDLATPVKIPVIEGNGGPHVGHHSAPHQGALVPIGKSDVHLEFVLEPETGLLTLYVLDAEAREPATMQQDMVFLKLQTGDGEFAIVLFGDPEFESSQRAGNFDQFAAHHRRLEGATRFTAEIEGVYVGGQAYRRIWFTYPDGLEP